MKIMKQDYDKKRKCLTVVFTDNVLIGFNSLGLRVYKECEKKQTFYGINKYDCKLRAKKYLSIPDVYVVKRHHLEAQNAEAF